MIERTVSHYRIVEACGGGSMGRVYRARDDALEKDVALKFLAPDLAADPDATARFRREAVMAAALDHQHICTIHEVGQDDDETWFMAMDWYEGGTLKDRLAAGPLPVDEAVRIARQICLGLDCAHRHGIVHRDVKPGNVAFNEADEVKVLDFGVAMIPDTTRLTHVGGLAGTVAYLAPEQLRNQEPTPKVDIWALGVVLHEMLTGQLPFRGDYPQAIMFAIANAKPEPLPPEVGAALPHLPGVVARCLTKDPQNRFAAAAEVAQALEAAPRREPQTTPRWLRRAALVAAAVGLLAVAYLNFMPHGGGRGVAVLPFHFLDGDGGETALGAGLAWHVADRLSRLEQATDAFWVVPPGEGALATIRDPGEVQTLLGVERTVRATGQVEGSVISLDVVCFDAATGERTSREFRDDVANLKTWQSDLPRWVALALAPDLAEADLARLEGGGTSVPAAFAAWLRGAGLVWQPLHGAALDSALAGGVAHLEAAVAADSSFLYARSDLAWARHRRERVRDPLATAAAAASLRRIGEGAPDAVWTGIYLAGLETYEGNIEAALARCDQVLAIDPVNAAAFVGKAKALRRLGRRDEAIAILDEACRRRPSYLPHLLDMGKQRYYAGDHEGALQTFTEATVAAPRNHNAHNFRGAALFALEREAEANAAFLESLAIEPSAFAYSNLATLRYYEGQYLEAAGYYQRALALRVSYGTVKGLAESWRWSPGHEDSARVYFRRAVRMLTPRVDALRAEPHEIAELATFHSYLGDRSRADSLLAQVVAHGEAMNSATAFYIAVVHEDLGRRDEALAWLETAFEQGLEFVRPRRYPGFSNLRADPRYGALMARVEADR